VALLRLESASFGYAGRTVVAGVDLSIDAGDFLGIVGPNGAGKTTLFRGLLGLIPPRAGRVHRDRVAIGYVPQRETLDPIFPVSVLEVVRMGAWGSLRGRGPFVREDRAAAQALLAAAGFPGGRGFPKFKLARPANSSRELGEAIQASWRASLGIEVELEVTESRTHWSNLQLRQYDLSIGGWSADYPDASTIFDLFARDSGWNFTGWSDPAYDAVLTASGADLDPASRLAKLQRCETLLLDALPVIPLNFPLTRTLQQPSVRDWSTTALDRVDYTSVWLAAP